MQPLHHASFDTTKTGSQQAVIRRKKRAQECFSHAPWQRDKGLSFQQPGYAAFPHGVLDVRQYGKHPRSKISAGTASKGWIYNKHRRSVFLRTRCWCRGISLPRRPRQNKTRERTIRQEAQTTHQRFPPGAPACGSVQQAMLRDRVQSPFQPGALEQTRSSPQALFFPIP